MNQYSNIRKVILLLTLSAIFAGLLVPKGWIESRITAFAIILILGGIPHGASDYLIFRQILANKGARVQKAVFLTGYLFIIFIYVLLWYFLPALAFAIFLLISIYHFGQSNWQYLSFDNKYWQHITYCIWGAFVIGIPVLIYPEVSSAIIGEITGQQISLDNIRWPTIFLLLGTNLINAVYLYENQLIAKDDMHKEIFSLFILFGLFISTPLLIGFGVYFLLWHSLGSILDQLKIFKSHDVKYDISTYLIQLLPLSLLAFLGLALAYLWFGTEISSSFNLSILFIFISVITVPHSILIDQFYLTKITQTEANNRKHEELMTY